MSWDTALYSFANTCMENSWKEWEMGNLENAWGYTIPARLAYLADLVVNIVQFPFAIIAITFGSVHALCTFDYQSVVFQSAKRFIILKTNHALISAFGGAISPAVAHKYQNANLAPFVIAARITVISTGFFYYVFM